MPPHPPRRTTHAYGTPKNLLVYDRWGRYGRPVVFLHGLGYDRTMWWPAAADLGGDVAAVAIDLPGHGHSAARHDCGLPSLVHDLIMLIGGLNLRRAPIVVGHAEAALLAEAFAERCATHAVLAVDEVPTGTDEPDLAGVPEWYRPFAIRRTDPALHQAYQSWHTGPSARRAITPAPIPVGTAAHAGSEGCLPHLRDPAGFAGLLQTLHEVPGRRGKGRP
ncbi:hypothetical protein Ait01nite_093320 [Actinoplanes italicus]|uniref:Alpha/beta hydrolase family protein n=1 Tax=Actinoplanes italicus TaxID=113567 RepID=A0A2T0JQP2_9ACTN|nr:alpha/beta hydrolase [Actinoplanes italicus]PRX09743.1 alpha/beta hydrolase family protein [Actinoplanes italicus]GIE36287.1 hypothetical protein Ait01nite_093320 [Actinoplanes italicus]